MDLNSKIYLAGHNGLVGSAIYRLLIEAGYSNVIYESSSKLDLTRQAEVEEFFIKNQPEYVFLSAGKVGGIGANNQYPAEFYYINSMIANNIIHSAYLSGVKKLLYLGSSCIYPRLAKQPIKEDELLGGYLESTNEGYAIAKISGVKMCDFYRKQYGCNFISAMPTNLYGIKDNFNLEEGHFIPSLIRKFHEAKIFNKEIVSLWGTGQAYREVMYVDDLADALLFIMSNYDEKGHINVGTGKDYSIMEYAKLIKSVVGFQGEIVCDTSKPDGTPKKLLDVSKLTQLGWTARTSLETGIGIVYRWFELNYTNILSRQHKS